jgi:pyridoxine 4-dehydrogenase
VAVPCSNVTPDTFDLDGETTVNRLGFGAMRLCGPDIVGPPEDEDGARSVVERAVELGVDFLDTADSYGPGVSERLLGETLGLAGEHDDVVVATKAGLLRNADGEWIPHGDPDYVRNQVLVSRDRLGVETIDCYQYHRPDPDTDFEETVTTFGELKDEGFVRHVGLSNVSVEQLETARDHVEVATVQNDYNLGNREHEAVLEACEDYGIGFVPYFPLGAGDLGEKESVVAEVAEAHDATREQVALAWLLERSEVTIPIPGTGSVDHLEENVAAAELSLTDAELARLSE